MRTPRRFDINSTQAALLSPTSAISCKRVHRTAIIVDLADLGPSDRPMKKQRIPVGSHIRVSRGSYDHHGVYIGRGRVAHYSGWSDTKLDKGKVAITTIQDFCKDGILALVSHQNALPKQQILQAVDSRIDEDRYSVIWNNCEHFATSCVTGRDVSRQVQIFVFGGMLGLQLRHLFQ